MVSWTTKKRPLLNEEIFMRKLLDQKDPSMDVIVSKLGLERKSGSSTKRLSVRCPFCDDKKFHMSISLDKWACHCWRCGYGGNGLTLYADVRGISNKDAYKELADEYGSETSSEPYKYKATKTEPIPEPLPDFDKYDKVYRALLSHLTLDDEHDAALISRGMSSEAIETGMYRSLPDIARTKDKTDADKRRLRLGKKLAKKLIGQGYDLSGVPGFYTDETGNWVFRYIPGMLVPVKDRFGRICTMQVRMNYGKSRYLTISSSGFENGTGAFAGVHITGNINKNTVIRITEGPLKADVAAEMTPKDLGVVYVAILGVLNTKNLYSFLNSLYKEFGPMKIENALDMDRFLNPNVFKASKVIGKRIQEIGHFYRELCWDMDFTKQKVDEFVAMLGDDCPDVSGINGYAKLDRLMQAAINKFEIPDWSYRWNSGTKGIDDYYKSLRDCS